MIAVLLQLSLPALLIAGASGAQRRWGPRVGGILTGLPITSLPLMLLISLAHGDRFAADAAGAGLEGTVAQAIAMWVLAVASHRWRPLAALGASLVAFASVTAALDVTPGLPTLLGTVAGAGAFGLALLAWPRPPGVDPAVSAAGHRGELPTRMALAAGFALAITEASGGLGAHLAGLVGALPVIALIMAVLTAREQGVAAASRFLRGVTGGSFAVVSALAVLAATLPGGHTVSAFAAALGAAAASLVAVEVVRALSCRPGMVRCVGGSLRRRSGARDPGTGVGPPS